jgi:MFS transporter, ACS family, D-galactonate transporter
MSQRKVLGLGFRSYDYVYYLLLTMALSFLCLHIEMLHSGVPWLFATATDVSGGWVADPLSSEVGTRIGCSRQYWLVGLHSV